MKINGKEIKLGEIRDAVALIILVFVATTSVASTTLELRQIRPDMLSLKASVESLELSHETLLTELARQDRRTWRIVCVVDMMAEGQPLGPRDCDPDSREESDE